MSNRKSVNDLLAPLIEQRQAIDNTISTFMSAQVAYAKSKHSKQAEQKKRVYKNRWFKGCK